MIDQEKTAYGKGPEIPETFYITQEVPSLCSWNNILPDTKTQVFIRELRLILFLPCVWNIPKGKLTGACYWTVFLIELHAFFFLLNSWIIFSIFVFHKFTWSYLCFIQFYSIFTLKSRLFLSHICCKLFFSFLVYVLSFWRTTLSKLDLVVIYPKFFVCLLLLMLETQCKAPWIASLAEKSGLIDRIQLLDWNNAACFYLTFVGHVISF